MIRELEGCSEGESNGIIVDCIARDLRCCKQNASGPCGRFARAPIQCPTECDEQGALECGISIPIDFNRWLHLCRLESRAGSMIAIFESWLVFNRSPARTIEASKEFSSLSIISLVTELSGVVFSGWWGGIHSGSCDFSDKGCSSISISP